MKTRSARTPRLGQHFLTNPHVARAVAESAGVHARVEVLEIGPGTGALTKELLTLGARVTAIEKDPSLVLRLRERFADALGAGTLRLIEGDVRDFDPATVFKGPYVLAANIPYYITGEIIRRFLTTRMKPQTISLLIQKEVAQRIVARDGKESILSISVKAFGTPRLVRSVSAGNFSPPPSVDSAILQISNISQDFFAGLDEARFFEIVKAGFSSKRKLLAGNLRAFMESALLLSACGIPEKARAEDLSLSDWQTLARALTVQG